MQIYVETNDVKADYQDWYDTYILRVGRHPALDMCRWTIKRLEDKKFEADIQKAIEEDFSN